MTVRRAVAVVVGADSVLFHVTIGACGDGAEEEVLRSRRGRYTERERAGGVAVDAVGAAAGLASDGAGGIWVGYCRCEAEDGGEAEEERGILHRDQGNGAQVLLRE